VISVNGLCALIASAWTRERRRTASAGAKGRDRRKS
jgi:hypothetical protein